MKKVNERKIYPNILNLRNIANTKRCFRTPLTN